MTLSPGTRLGPYEILSPLGAGGMGQVYRARDTGLGRDVALKTLPDSFTHDPERLARFRREQRAFDVAPDGRFLMIAAGRGIRQPRSSWSATGGTRSKSSGDRNEDPDCAPA